MISNNFLYTDLSTGTTAYWMKIMFTKSLRNGMNWYSLIMEYYWTSHTSSLQIIPFL